MSSFYDFSVENIDGEKVSLSDYKGKVVLVVNVASQCGFTPQYKDLEALQEKFGSKGFSVLAFPCNQFGGQEPGDSCAIKSFAEKKGATFPVFAKIDVNGDGADPLFKWLKAQKGGLITKSIKWNFTKFLVDANGKVISRYGSITNPSSIGKDIEKLLN